MDFIHLANILSLDLGSKTIGIAKSDDLGIAAHAITTIFRRDLDWDLQELGKFITDYQITTIVLGYPLHKDGNISESAKKSEVFKEILEKHFSLPVILWDERYTTQEAEDILLIADISRKKRKKVINQLAAQRILTSYMEAKRNNSDSDNNTKND